MKIKVEAAAIILFIGLSVALINNGYNSSSNAKKNQLAELAKQDYKGSTGVSIENIYWLSSEYPSFYKGNMETEFGQNVSFYVTKDGKYLVPEGRFRNLNNTEEDSGHTHPHPHGSRGEHQ